MKKSNSTGQVDNSGKKRSVLAFFLRRNVSENTCSTVEIGNNNKPQNNVKFSENGIEDTNLYVISFSSDTIPKDNGHIPGRKKSLIVPQIIIESPRILDDSNIKSDTTPKDNSNNKKNYRKSLELTAKLKRVKSSDLPVDSNFLFSWDQVLKETFKGNVDILRDYFPDILPETCEPLLKHLDEDVVEAACWLKKRGWKLNNAGNKWLKENIKSKQGIFYKEIYNQI